MQSFFSIGDGTIHGWRKALPYTVLVSATLAIYLQTLAYGFVWDDTQYVVDNFTIQSLKWENFYRIWTTPHLYNYAPLHLLLLALIHGCSGLNPVGFHLAQLILHAACVCLVYYVVKGMESPRIALLGAFWFAVFPPNVESVAWVSESKSTLAFLLFLISFLFFLRHRKQERASDATWCGIFLVLSLLAKVSTIVAPAIFLAYDLREGRIRGKSRWRTLLCYTGICAVFVAVHITASRLMRQGALERLRDAAITSGPGLAENSETYFGGFWIHILNVPSLLLHYMRMAVMPSGMSPWQMVHIDTAFNLHAVFMWAFAAGMLLGLFWLRPRQRFWGLWFILFLAPVLQIVPNATWVADRYLYIPAIGLFVLLSKLFFFGVDRLSSASVRALAELFAAALLIVSGWQAHRYVTAWSDDVTLWSRALPVCVESAFCHFKLGDAEVDAGSGNPIGHFERAVALRPEVTYRIALARAYTDQAGDYPRANQLYQQMQREGRQLPLGVVTSIARNYYLAGDFAKTENAVNAGLTINPNFSSLLIVKGFLLWRQGNFAGARHALRQALDINRANAQAQHPPKFLSDFWRRPAEVGELMHDLGSL